MSRNIDMLPTLQEIREAHSWKRDYEKYLPLSRFVFRPIGFLLTWVAIRFGLTSESVSWISGAVGLAGCYCLVNGDAELLSTGIGLLFLFNLLDCVDGSIARTMKTENPYGRFLDSICGSIVDLIFWCIIGVTAFHHPNLTFWLDAFGHGSLFWLLLGFATSFLNIFHGYTERTFDELLRQHWEKIREIEKEESGIVPVIVKTDTTTDTRTRIILRIINNNLRVRETHYILFLLAFWMNAVDMLLLICFFYYLSQNIILLITYSRRGQIIKKKCAS